MGVSIQQTCIAKHYLMTNNIVIYHFKALSGLHCGNKLGCFGLKVGVAHKHRLCNEIKGSIVLNKQKCIYCVMYALQSFKGWLYSLESARPSNF